MKYYKLHLIRHGLTAGNLQGLYIGSGSDLPLCDEGRAQLKTLKKDFDYPVVPLVFTSPMKRATETAEILFPGVRQIELDDLREMAFGKFEGRAVQELVKDPEFAQWMDPTSRTVPAGAEDRQMFFNRTSSMLMKMFEYMLGTHTEEATAIRAAYKDTFFLIPGYGAQGGKAADIAQYLTKGNGGVVNSSRGILLAYKKQPGVAFDEAAYNECVRMREDIQGECNKL